MSQADVRKKAKEARRSHRKEKAIEKRALRVGKGPTPDDQELHAFWLAHGANFLESDYAEGVWTPLFEGIYEEGGTISLEEIQKTTYDRYYDETNKMWLPGGQALATWIAQDAVVTAVMRREAEKRTGSAQDARNPRDPKVWGLFAHVRKNALEPHIPTK